MRGTSSGRLRRCCSNRSPGTSTWGEVLEALQGIDGLDDIHDVHVWTLTSGFVALSGHGVIDDPVDHTRVLEEVRGRMGAFGIRHVTFQIELRPLVQMRTDSD